MTSYSVNNTEQEKKIYCGREYEHNLTTNTQYNYIYVGDMPIALYVQGDTNAMYTLHTNYIGSIEKISDKNGNVVDSMSYTPFGQRRMFSDWSKTDTAKHLIDRGFTGQQHLDNFALINFNGRMYDPVLAHFLSPDPYIQSPENPLNYNRYSYCLFSPLQYTDPTGLLIDEWEINRFGKIVNHIVTDKHDAFYIVDDEGNRIEGKELIFPYGTVERFNSQYSDQAKTTFDWYDIRGDENGTQLFEFLATNTSVEWGQLQMGQKGDNGLNVVTTSHSSDKESCGTFLIKNKYKYGYTIRKHNHNHPRNTAYPSGLDGTKGDISFARWLERISPNISLNIYLPKSQTYLKYHSNSQKKDFPALMVVPTQYLKEFIITAPKP